MPHIRIMPKEMQGYTARLPYKKGTQEGAADVLCLSKNHSFTNNFPGKDVHTYLNSCGSG